MGRSRRREIPPSCKTYGFPLYCSGWVPVDKIVGAAGEGKETEEKPRGADDAKEAAEGAAGSAGKGSAAPEEATRDEMVLMLGGGGGGRLQRHPQLPCPRALQSGVPHAVGGTRA